jgi:ribosomal protein S6E (S10)
MSRCWFASGGLTLLGLVLGMGTFADDVAKVDTESTIKDKTAAILRKLEKPIPLKVKDVPLGEVFRYVMKATAEPGDTGVPIDVDPAALAKAQVMITTPVTYESKEGEPLKDSLATVLGSLGLRLRVEDGLLRISWTMYRLIDRDPQTKFIRDRLEEKVDLSFEKTSLEDVLKHIKEATSKGQDGKGIPIYVDLVGLLEAEKTLTTPISFTAKGEPLKSSLERLLKSIDLTYVVKDGLLTVTSRMSEDLIPDGDTTRP